MKVYISLPITGKELVAQKRLAGAVAARLREGGHHAINPFRNGIKGRAPWEEHMAADLLMLMGCEAVCLCPGWEESKGCLLEKAMAERCGMAVYRMEDLAPCAEVPSPAPAKGRAKAATPPLWVLAVCGLLAATCCLLAFCEPVDQATPGSWWAALLATKLGALAAGWGAWKVWRHGAKCKEA